MSEESEVNRLRKDIVELRRTVQSLKETVTVLTNRLYHDNKADDDKVPTGNYSISKNLQDCVQYDASWSRLVGILEGAEAGLTAAELAKLWGKSRSRTSEVLNRLVGEGHVVKYRDGREIKFRPTEE